MGRAPPLYPPGFADPVPPAGIVTERGSGVAGCFRRDDTYKGGDVQWRYRQHYLGEPGEPLTTRGVVPKEWDPRTLFGDESGDSKIGVRECVCPGGGVVSKAGKLVQDAAESLYDSHKCPVGQGLTRGFDIPDDIKARGFGRSTTFGESAASVIHSGKMDYPSSGSHDTSKQFCRGYDWNKIGLDPTTHKFGDVGEPDIDHLGPVFQWGSGAKSVGLVDAGVDRLHTRELLGDRSIEKQVADFRSGTRPSDATLTHRELKQTIDPSLRPAAGIITAAPEFSVGDTFRSMGLQTAVGPGYQRRVKDFHMADHLVHGIRTRPNPFKNPLCGPGRYADMLVRDEDFLLKRSREEVVTIMKKAFDLSEEVAVRIFDLTAAGLGREEISVAEFYETLKACA